VPTRAQCLSDVQDHGVGGISPLNAGDQICVTSQGGRVAYLRLTAAVPQRVEVDLTVFR